MPVADLMTKTVRCLPLTATCDQAARLMAEHDIGDVLVTSNGRVKGILTDRDITVRVVAEGRDPAATRLEEVCSHDVLWVAPGDDIQDALDTMRAYAIRRLPVLVDGKPVGILTLGDVAEQRAPSTVLAHISAAQPLETPNR